VSTHFSPRDALQPLRVTPLVPRAGVVVESSAQGDPLPAPEAIIGLVKVHGAVALHGFDIDLETFERYSGRFHVDFMSNLGSGSWRKTMNQGSDGTIQDVAYRYGSDRQQTFPLPLHADRAYVKSAPEVMFFACMEPAVKDGQTTVCDGIAVYRALSPQARRRFDERDICYLRRYAPDEWQLIYRTTDIARVREYCDANEMTLELERDGAIVTRYVTTAVPRTRWQGERAFCNSLQIGYWQEHTLGRAVNRVRWADGSEIDAGLMAEVDDVCAGLTADIPWVAGDIAIVDNTRMLHGRRAFDDDVRQILVRMGQKAHW
jgi:alpha-ketoglutarate-dependent taurine dioxygenase